MVQGDGAPSSPFGGLPVLWFEGEPADEVYVVGADFRERFGHSSAAPTGSSRRGRQRALHSRALPTARPRIWTSWTP